MPTILSPEILSLVGVLGVRFDLGRHSAHMPARRGVIFGKRYRGRLESLRGDDPATRAARGRLLRLLGEPESAADELAASCGDPRAPACAFAFRWELESSRGKAPGADLGRAIAMEPGNGWWRLWNAVRLMDGAPTPKALEEVQAASERLPGRALPHLVGGLIWWYQRNDPAKAVGFLDAGLALEPGIEWAYRLRAMCRHERGDAAGCLKDCLTAMRLNEQSTTLFIPLGLYRGRSDSRRHIEVADSYIKKDPRAYWAYLYRAEYKRGPDINENSGALEDLLRAASLAPKSAAAWAYLARCQTAMGDFKSANAAIEKAAALDPQCGWIRAWKGEQRRRVGDIKTAASELDAAVRLFPDYEVAYAWRAGARLALGRPKPAVEDLDIAIGLHPVNAAWCFFERMNAKRALGWTAAALDDAERAHRLNSKYTWENEPKRFDRALAELDAEIKRAPRGALARIWRGDILIRLRDFRGAADCLDAAVRCDTKSARARILRGRALGELGRWTQALKDFKAAVRFEPDFAFGHAWLGRAKMVRGDYKGAVGDLSKALSVERSSAWILSWRGEAYFRLKRHQEAVDDLSQALEVHSRYADALLWRGASLLSLGRLEPAESDLGKALEIRPDDAQARFYRGLVHVEAGRSLEARKELEEAMASGGLSPEQRRLGSARLRELKKAKGSPAEAVAAAEALQRDGRHDAAVEAYSGALAGAPNDHSLYKKRAEAYRCQGRYDLALKDLLTVARLRPREAGALASVAEMRRRLFDFRGGRRDARAALALDARCAPAWVVLSELERALGRCDEAVRAASKAVDCDASWGWALIVRAKAKRQKGEFTAAIADTRLAEKAHEDAYAWGWRGEILRKAGKPKEALALLDRAVERQPSNAWFLALRGETRRELGELEKALADLDRAVQLDPHASCDYDFLGAEPPAVRRDSKLAWVYAWRGGIHRKEGRLPQARADLERAASLDPSAFWILAWKGELLIHLGRTAAGLKDLDRALSLYPRYAAARVWKGHALLAAGRAQAASAEFRKALAADPQNVWALLGEASSLEKLGRARQAGVVAERARSLAPGLFEAAAG
ncbi:MAG: tetratricopeptide repeat protein [Elusimicrobia bacterium]|nr:tetratricopeptide repeat protein [Elusimicrobiota bacterium]